MMNEDFSRRMTALLGQDEFVRFRAALSAEPAIAIRPNRARGFDLTAPLRPVPWSGRGYYLENRLPFTFDPLFHAGGYYVQEPSSMFVEQAFHVALQGLGMDISDGDKLAVLDLCAAPGGKSTLVRSLMGDGNVLVSNEVDPRRAQILLENMVKWGQPDVCVTQSGAEAVGAVPDAFDIVLVDAPCSGEGMFRKDPAAVAQWSPRLVAQCSALQRTILESVWSALRSGGYLIYSTCTYSLEEDEQNVDWAIRHLDAEVVEVPVEAAWGVTGNLCPDLKFPVCRFLPHKVRGEGFFLALLRKSGRHVPTDVAPRMRKVQKRVRMLFPEQNTMPAVSHDKRSRRSGVGRSGKTLPTTADTSAYSLPSAQMNLRCRPVSLPTVELSYADALRYLRHEAISLPPLAERGLVVVTYGHCPLGYAKNVGNRANNLYPSSWRIRSGHLPEPFPSPVKLFS